MSTSETDAVDELIAQLGRHERELDRAEERVAEFGREDLEELAEAYEAFTALLDRYEDTVTGDEGDIQTIVEFQSQIDEMMSGVSDDMLLSETFDDCDEYLQKKWFKKSDFEHVREQLQPVADLVSRLEAYEETLNAYRSTRRQIEHRVRELDQRIADLERLSRLGDADLDAPTERLREPIAAYNDAVTDALGEFKREAPAREIIEFLESMAEYPLVPFEPPPEEMTEYVREHPPGEETIPTLLEYANYSRSKLDHYVDDPGALEHTIGGQKTYLQGLDAEPLRIEWPPPAADELEWRCRELTAAVNRFAPPVVESLRRVAALPRETDYERLRDSALAAQELSEAERERLQTGTVETELEEARAKREQLRDALESYPAL